MDAPERWTESELFQSCLKNDRIAQKELFRRYSGKLYVICLRYARHSQEAEDMLQDGFIRVFQNISTFRSEGSFEGWLRRVIVNVAIRYVRKSHFTKEVHEQDMMPDNGEIPEVLGQLNESELLNLIAALPEGYRMIFNLHAIEGYKHSEIANMLGIEESTSRSQLVKARRMLQDRIAELYKIRV